MCESKAYLKNKDGVETKIMDAVIVAVPKDNGVYLEDILGDSKFVEGTLREVKLLDHRIVIEA
ncbi:MAG: CooT family nickel-binding protein [Anaerofustis stercorihominis]|nr:CooT family nickel-binding protein [Anaerofustis stercorihominis]